MQIERIVQHLEDHEEDRPIAKKNKINCKFLIDRYPRLTLVGSDSTIEEIIADAIDIDRKIRRAKQLHPHLAGDDEDKKIDLERDAREDLGYTDTL